MMKRKKTTTKNKSQTIITYTVLAVVGAFCASDCVSAVQETPELKRGLEQLASHDYKSAQSSFNDLIEKDPRSVDGHTGEARALIGLGKFSRALDEADQGLRASVGNSDALVARAQAYNGLHKFSEALADCAQVLKKKPNEVPALYTKALAETGLERFKDALDDANKAVDLEPTNAIAMSVRARICLILEEYDRAIRDCDRAIALDGRLGAAYLCRAKCYHRLGKKNLSAADYKAAKKLGCQE